MGRGKSADASDFWSRFEALAPKDLAVSIAANIKPSTLSSYKNEKRYPRANEAVALAKALDGNVSVEYLVTGQDCGDAWVREHAAFIAACKELDAAGAFEPVADYVEFTIGKARASEEARRKA